MNCSIVSTSGVTSLNFLIALNALPPFFGNAASRLRLRDIVFILFMGVLLVAGHTLMSGVFRYASEVPAFPEGYDLDSAMQSAGPVTGWRQTAQGLLAHPGWSLVMAAPVVTALAALPWIWRLRQRWLAAAGAALVLLLALVHQFAAAASVLLLMLLARVLKPVDLRTRGASTYFGAILASLVAWACLGLFSDLVRKNGAKPYYYMTWAREKSPEQQAVISRVYRETALTNNAIVVPVGEAWAMARAERPDFRLYFPD